VKGEYDEVTGTRKKNQKQADTMRTDLKVPVEGGVTVGLRLSRVITVIFTKHDFMVIFECMRGRTGQKKRNQAGAKKQGRPFGAVRRKSISKGENVTLNCK